MIFSPPLLLDVQVMPRVRKYLAVHYPNGIPLEPTDARLFHIWCLAQTEKVKLRLTGRTPKPLSDTIQVAVRQTTESRRCHLFNEMETKMVNKLLDLLIYQEFFAQVKADQAKNIGIYQSIRQFTDRYDFSDDELAEETLRIAAYRHQTRGQLGFDEPQLQGAAINMGMLHQSPLTSLLVA
ncbi:hypothetical protein [Spirosoma litoris]